MTKIPVNKEESCRNLEGLLHYERATAEYVYPSDKKKQVDYMLTDFDALRREYCGGMCFKRYHCKLAERYLQ